MIELSRSYKFQVLSLDIEDDGDIIEYLDDLKERRLASSFIKQAIRNEMRGKTVSEEG